MIRIQPSESTLSHAFRTLGAQVLITHSGQMDVIETALKFVDPAFRDKTFEFG